MNLKSLAAAAAVVTLAGAPAFAQAPAAAPPMPATPGMGPMPGMAAPASGYAQISPRGDIVQTLQSSGQFTTLMKALDQTNLTNLVRRPQPITLFAPTDAAFAALPPGELANLMKPDNAAQLQSRIVYLIFNGALPYEKLKGKNGPIAGAGGQIFVNGSDAPTANDANILQADVKAANGDIYVVDKVIGPGYTPPPAPPAEAAPAAPAPAK